MSNTSIEDKAEAGLESEGEHSIKTSTLNSENIIFLSSLLIVYHTTKRF